MTRSAEEFVTWALMQCGALSEAELKIVAVGQIQEEEMRRILEEGVVMHCFNFQDGLYSLVVV